MAIKEAEAEADKLRIEAQGKAESTLIEAEAQADAVKLAADAEAYKLEQIAGKVSSEIIQKILAEQWDGELPQVAGGALAGIPGMFFIVPVISVFYVLLRDYVQKRNAELSAPKGEEGA